MTSPISAPRQARRASIGMESFVPSLQIGNLATGIITKPVKMREASPVPPDRALTERRAVSGDKKGAKETNIQSLSDEEIGAPYRTERQREILMLVEDMKNERKQLDTAIGSATKPTVRLRNVTLLAFDPSICCCVYSLISL